MNCLRNMSTAVKAKTNTHGYKCKCETEQDQEQKQDRKREDKWKWKWEYIRNENKLKEMNIYKKKKTKLCNKKKCMNNEGTKYKCHYLQDCSKTERNISTVLETAINDKTLEHNSIFLELKKKIIKEINYISFSRLHMNRRYGSVFCEEKTFPVPLKEKMEKTEKTEKIKTDEQCNNKQYNNKQYNNGNYDNEDKNKSRFDIFVNKQNAINSIISSTFAGIISRTVTAPLDRVKYIMQVTNNITIYEIFEIIKKDGAICGFFRGNYVNIIKIVPELSIKMYSYEFLKINAYKYYYLKNNINCTNEESIDIPFYLRFLIGSASGMIAAISVYPLEIVKTRLIVSNKIKDNGIIQCLSNIYKKEKIRNFYNGLSMHLYGVIFFSGCNMSIYDYLKYLFFSFYKNYVHQNYCLKNNVKKQVDNCTGEIEIKNTNYTSAESNSADKTHMIHITHLDSVDALKEEGTNEVKLLSNTLGGGRTNSFKGNNKALQEEKEAVKVEEKNVHSINKKELFATNGFLNTHNFIKLYNSKNSKHINELNLDKNITPKENYNTNNSSSFVNDTQKNETTPYPPKHAVSSMSISPIVNSHSTNDTCSYCDYRIKNVNCFLFLFFGITSSFIAQLVSYPFLVLRTRMQTLNNEMVANYLNSERKTIKSCSFIIHNIKMYGFRSLYRGIYVNLLKTIPATSITWFSYEFSMRKLQNRQRRIETGGEKETDTYN